MRVIRSGGPEPWNDYSGFLSAVLEVARADLLEGFNTTDVCVHDRGLFDALSALAEAEGTSLGEYLPSVFPYAQPVFFAPPWSDIYRTSESRRHSFEVAVRESLRLKRDLQQMGVNYLDLPQCSPQSRADFVMDQIAKSLS